MKVNIEVETKLSLWQGRAVEFSLCSRSQLLAYIILAHLLPVTIRFKYCFLLSDIKGTLMVKENCF